MSIRIVFMGTPDFAVASLDAIAKSNIEIAGVITAPDKPAGRGKKIQASAVKRYALENNLAPILQPTNLKDENFLNELRNLNADLFAVVAFRMLPEAVWNMPKFGAINLHASLLPDYRGAAPINRAIINGEQKTGATTFFIKKEIDTGNIIKQIEVNITNNDSAGTLHDRLMVKGADLLVNTIKSIEARQYETISQDNLINKNKVKQAPKIFKEDCRINWAQPTQRVYNLIRGLSPYPAARTELTGTNGNKISIKIFETSPEITETTTKSGTIDYSETGVIKIACSDGFIKVKSLQMAGKKRMDTKAFLLGFNEKDNYLLAT